MPSEHTGFRLRLLSPLLGISAGSCVVLSLNTILAPWVALFWTVSCILAFAAFYRGKKEVFSYRFRLITVLGMEEPGDDAAAAREEAGPQDPGTSPPAKTGQRAAGMAVVGRKPPGQGRGVKKTLLCPEIRAFS